MTSISIEPYSGDWPLRFAREHVVLSAVFDGMTVEVEHIGSTSVPGLAAKPVIDVLLGADSLAAIESRTAVLARLGYEYVAKYERDLPMRRFFFKPEDRGMLRVNLHAIVLGSTFWQEHIPFRDALRSDGALLADYCVLKQALAARYPDDMPSYTAAKTSFIRSAIGARQPRDSR